MTIQEAIQKAIEGGWHELEGDPAWWRKPWGPQPGRSTPLQDLCEDFAKGEDKNQPGTSWLLDPTFWQALGKAMGWNREFIVGEDVGNGKKTINDMSGEWLYHWHRFIDHLAEGGSMESYFETLTN